MKVNLRVGKTELTVVCKCLTIPNKRMRKECDLCKKRKSSFGRAVIISEIRDGQLPVKSNSALGRKAVKIIKKCYCHGIQICDKQGCANRLSADTDRYVLQAGVEESQL